MSWKDLIKLDDSINYIISTWKYINYPNNINIDGQNNNIQLESNYTNIITKPKLIINPLNTDGSLNIGGYLDIICRDTYGDKKFEEYLSNRLITEGWKKYFDHNRTYYRLKDLIYEFKTNNNSIMTISNDNLFQDNRNIIAQLEYEVLSGEPQNSRYYKKLDDNKYKLYFYPVQSNEFYVHKPVLVKDNIYLLEINNDLSFDNDIELEFKDQIHKIKYYFLTLLGKNQPLYISKQFKDDIYWNITG
jgi:hypothetical protein